MYLKRRRFKEITGHLLGEVSDELDTARVAVNVTFDIENFVGMDMGNGEEAKGKDESNSFCHFFFIFFVLVFILFYF